MTLRTGLWVVGCGGCGKVGLFGVELAHLAVSIFSIGVELALRQSF